MRFKRNSSEYLEYYRKIPGCFGGALHPSHPKKCRPIDANQALHVVLRSPMARGKLSMLRDSYELQIKLIIRRQARTFGIKIHRYANGGNHLHMLVSPPANRAHFAHFLRAVSGLVARLVLKAERGRAKGEKFWQYRPFSRTVAFGRAFEVCRKYISKNIFEVFGFEGLDIADDEEKIFWAWAYG